MLIIKQPLHAILLVFMLLGLVACGGGESTDSDSSQLSRIELQVDSDNLPTNSSTKITAIAYYDDDTNENITPLVEWSVNDENLASIDANGELKAKSLINSVDVVAKYKTLSISKTFNITPTPGAKILQLTLDPSVASAIVAEQEITITAKYDDGSIQENVTGKVESVDTAQSASPKVILKLATTDVEISIPETIDTTQALTLAANELNAPEPEKTLQSISISADLTTLTSGDTTSVTVKATYSDASTAALNNITFSTSGPISVSDANTIITAQAVTEITPATLTVEFNGISDSKEFSIQPAQAIGEITPAVLDSLIVTIGKSTILSNETTTILATGHYSDNTTKNLTELVTWSSSNNLVATVDAVTGKVTPASETGSTTLTATIGNITDSTTVTVNAVVVTLDNITINSAKLNLKTQESLTVTATGKYTDNQTKDISNSVVWETSDSNIISIDNTSGVMLIAHDAEGPVTISASQEGISHSLNFNVSKPATITGIRINKTTLSLNTNSSSGALQVYADFSDGSESNISGDVTWSSSNSDVVAVDSTGLLTTLASTGDAIISANYSPTNETVSTSITVSLPSAVKIQSVYITNLPGTLFFNQNHSLSLRGILDDKSEINLEQNITWTITDSPAARINSAGIVSTSNINETVFVNATYTDITNATEFYDTITINIKPENSYDNFNLKLADLPPKSVIEDVSNFAPVLKAFYNPVGITQDIGFTSAHPGIFFTYVSSNTPERLSLILPDSTPGTFDETSAKLFYIPEKNADELYLLDGTANTSLNVNLINYASQGEIASGVFTAKLCSQRGITLNKCSEASYQLKLSGSFYLTVDEDSTFTSNYSIDNPALVYVDNMNIVQQISASQPNYHYEDTIKGVTYHFKTNNNDVIMEVVDSATKSNVLLAGELRNTDPGYVANYTATESKTYLRVTYTGSESGTTYKASNATDGLVAQGTAQTPKLIGQKTPTIFDQGTVDTTISYYQVDVLAGHKYRINLTKISNTLISVEASDTNNDAAFTPCPFVECDIDSATGKVFIRVNGANSPGASYEIEVEYAPERFPDVTMPIVDRIGQVSYKDTVFSAVANNNDFNSGTSNYWISAAQLTAGKHYVISIKGLRAFTQLYINDRFSTTLEEECASGGTWNAPATQNADFNLNEIYCVVKTRVNMNTSNGFSINILGERSGSGTPYILNVSEIDSSRVFYVSSYANKATGDLGYSLTNAPFVAMNFFRQGEDKPFTFTLPNISSYARKALVLNPGETVLIRAFDAFSYGNFYSIKIQQNGFYTSTGLVRVVGDPDDFESGTGDNSAASATVIQLGQETNHSFSFNNGQFGDEDWFSFTAP